MDAPTNNFPTYEQWQHLKPDQRDYLLWETLSTTRSTLAAMPQTYAKKQIEKIVYSFISLILVGFASALINLVLRQVK